MWFAVHTGWAVAAVAITAFAKCRDNLWFAAALLAAWLVTLFLPSLEPATDMLDAVIGCAAVMVWLARRHPLWDWRVALAIICVFAQGFHAAHAGGLYDGDAAHHAYQVRLNILFDLALLCTVTSPLKSFVGWFGDRFLPVPDSRHGVGAPQPSQRGATWP